VTEGDGEDRQDLLAAMMHEQSLLLQSSGYSEADVLLSGLLEDPVAATPSLSAGTDGSLVTLAPGESGVSLADIAALAQEAATRWTGAGLSQDQLAALGQITYRIENLDGNRLGYADGMVIVIDSDAAGRAWYVDSTASIDEEFDLSDLAGPNALGTSAASGRFDLLTTILHEQGHVLGLADQWTAESDVMHAFLQTGQRRLPAAGQAEGSLVSHEADGLEYLTAAFGWTGAAGDNDATNGENWAGGVAPSTMDDLVFATGAGTVDFSRFAAGTRFNTIQISGSGFTLTGVNSIELYGGLTVNSASGAINTVDLDITLANAQTIMNANAGSVLDITGTIDTGGLLGTAQVAGVNTGTSALTFDGAGATNVSGVIEGQGSLAKLGSGTLTLSAGNTYKGITDVPPGSPRGRAQRCAG